MRFCMEEMAVPPFMGQEIEWAVRILQPDGKYRFPRFHEFLFMINAYREMLDYPIKDPDFLKGFHEQLREQKSKDVFIAHDRGVLPSGFRYYVDGHHLELSSPGCRTINDLIISDRAGELILRKSAATLEECLDHGCRVEVFKDTSNRKGTSFAGHENYLLNSKTFHKIVDWVSVETMLVASFFALRIILTGAGRAGSDKIFRKRRKEDIFFQISQRADWMRAILHWETIQDRPLVNARNEPHASFTEVSGRSVPVSRFHVICGEPNMSLASETMRFGFASIYFLGLQDRLFKGMEENITLLDPVDEIKEISRDIDCQKTVTLLSGKRARPYEILRIINERLRWYFNCMREPTDEQKKVMDKVDYYCDCFAKGPEFFQERLITELDWVNRLDVCRSVLELSGGVSPLEIRRRLYYNDLKYADIDPRRSLYYQRERFYEEAGLPIKKVTEREIKDRFFNSPTDSREYLRGEILKKFPNLRADWSLIYSKEEDILCLADPLRGGKNEIGNLVKECRSVNDLIFRLKNFGIEIYHFNERRRL